MKVVFYGNENFEEIDLDNNNTVLDVFDRLGIPIETHVVLKNGKLVCEHEKLSDGDNLVFMRVGSSG